MKLSLERKITFGFSGALLVLLLVTAVAWWNAERFSGTHYWVNQTRNVLGLLEQTQSNVLGMQASARGFVLTGSDEVLQPFEVNRVELERTLAALRTLIAESPRQKERLARLEPLAMGAQASLRARIAARRSRGIAALGETEAYLAEQRDVDAIRGVIREMVAEERKRLDSRLERSGTFGRWTVFAIVGASALTLGLVVFALRQVGHDLRLRREAEAALQQSYARIEDLYHHAPCGYHSLDANGMFVALNDTALAWLGYTREEVVGRMRYPDILTPESAVLFATRFEKFKREGASVNVEYAWRRKDGSVLPVLLNATAVYDAAGGFVASRATVFDVTQRKRAEEERDRFFTLSRDLLCIASFDGHFKRVNPAWEAVLGLKPEELLAQPVFAFIHPEDRARTADELAKLATGEESVEFENRYRTHDGSYRWLRWSARPVLAEQLIYASARDVTERREANDNILKLNSDLAVRAGQLESANRELESFSYSVSHDLRAPLRHIDGFAGLLAKKIGPHAEPEVARYITTISRAAKQMGMLIDDLLAFSRIGRVPLRLERLDHNRLVADVIANGHYGRVGPAISWEIAPLPEVHADASTLRQVWANLLENAVKYSSKVAQPRISIGSTRGQSDGEVAFFVRDNGVGFDMAYVDKLFGVFQRLHGPAEFEGTGIGLANVRRIIARHGGRTWAEGRVGEGAAFYFSLPVTFTPARA